MGQCASIHMFNVDWGSVSCMDIIENTRTVL